MDNFALISLVSVLGWLVLAIVGLRSQRIETRKMVWMAGAWLAIILGLVVILKVAGVA